MSLPPETVEALRVAAATRADIARLVHTAKHVEPRSEEPFDEHHIVVVLEDPPAEPPPFEFTRGLVQLLGQHIAGLENVGITIPSPAGLSAATRGGVVIYERDGAA